LNYFPIKCHFFAVILDLPFYSLLNGPLRETARSQSDSAISTEQLAHTHTHTHTRRLLQPPRNPFTTASTFHYLHSQASHTQTYIYIHTYTHRRRKNQREQLIKVA